MGRSVKDTICFKMMDIKDNIQRKKRDKNMKKMWKYELKQANEYYEHVKSIGLENADGQTLSEIAHAWYENGMYTESAPLFQEILNRDFSSKYGNTWKECAMNLFYFGFGGVKKNTKISGKLAIDMWEQETDLRYVTAKMVLRTLETPYNLEGKFKKFDRSQLLDVDMQRFENLLNQDYEIAIGALKSSEYQRVKEYGCYSDNAHTGMILLKEAYEDLKKMGYWNLSTTEELVQMLNKEVEKENPAAMYWLAQCGHHKMMKMSVDKITELLVKSVNAKYYPAMELFYSSYLDELDEDYQKVLKGNMDNINSYMKTTYVHTRQF